MVPKNTKPRKRAHWTRVFFAPSPPAATPRPFLLSRKQNGWLVLFFSPAKRERFSLPYFGHKATRYGSMPLSRVRRTRQQLKRSLKMHRQCVRGEGGEEGRKQYRDIECGRLLLKGQSLTNIAGSFLRHEVLKFLTAQRSAVHSSWSWMFTSMSSL